MSFTEIVEFSAQSLDAAGTGIIILGIIITTYRFMRTILKEPANDAYRDFRKGIGRALLLGLEFLVAADIIRTVAIRPTFESVGVLALIVLIRTFLSWTLELEIEGRWPWQRHE